MSPSPPTEAATRALRGVWQALPESVTRSGLARASRRAVLRGLRGAPPPEQRVIRTLGELDEEIGRLEQAVRVSDEQLRAGFEGFRMELDVEPPADPFSDAYREFVLGLYEWLHGGPYRLDNEMTPFDRSAAVQAPFPYLTGSPAIVGDYMMAIGHLVRTVGVGPGARVLELGPGWGNVALPLARLGCDVTTLDVSPDFASLIDARAEQLGVKVRNLVGDYSGVADMEEQFDAVVFFESFHHSADHLRLLSDLHRVVAPGGRVVFAAEPVNRRFWAPWGVRLDGESLWAIRRNGWLELGFRRSYFLEALRRTGWAATRHNCSDTRWGDIFVAVPG